jgi:hypothetical protein
MITTDDYNKFKVGTKVINKRTEQIGEVVEFVFDKCIFVRFDNEPDEDVADYDNDELDLI